MNTKEKSPFNKKNYFLVNYGLYIIIIISLSTLLLLFLLKIEDKSILEMAINYYRKT